MSERVFYFGDSRLRPGPGAGHHLWSPRSDGYVAWANESDAGLPWTRAEIDARLAGDPALEDLRSRGHWARDAHPEGIVRLHHRAGWTAISFWDRSGDSRHGSSSTFIAEGTLTARDMVTLFQQSFPLIWERITQRFQFVLPAEASTSESTA